MVISYGLEVVLSTQMYPSQVVVPPHADSILEEVGQSLQITPSQFARAERAYGSVGAWLAAEGSPLAAYLPEVYPQGSMALRTTVRPLHEDEFDLDLVVEVHGWSASAMDLYRVTGARLAEHREYRTMLEPKNRCWRLNYAGDFHLDALPGREDLLRTGNAIEIPDRALEDWKPTNPRDYAAWFDGRSRPFYAAIEARGIQPLVAPSPEDAKDALRRSVQLLKRHRDIRFDGHPDSAPRSIVLTTLAGKYYGGQPSIGEAMLVILAGIRTEIAAHDGPFKVPNPVNEDENFADAWEEEPAAYDEFVGYVDQLYADFGVLVRTPAGGLWTHRAGALFGEAVTKRAVNKYNEDRGNSAAETLHSIAVGARGSAKPWCVV